MFRARLCGEPLRLIAKRFGVSVSAVERAVYERCTVITPENRQHALRVEIERLDRLWSVFDERAQEGSEAAAAICLRISERRSSMWGLDSHSPVQPLLLVEATRAAPSSVDRIRAAIERVARSPSSSGNGSAPDEEPSGTATACNMNNKVIVYQWFRW
jgi:hypothetical protein